jgi:hypothetical protein
MGACDDGAGMKSSERWAWIHLVLVAGLAFGAGGWQIAEHARLAARLWGRPLLERGSIAVDESISFLARAGRVQARRERIHPGGRGSSLAAAWVWTAEAASDWPPRARIYLNVPGMALYFYGNFFWFEQELDVRPDPVVITDGITLARAARHIPREEIGRLSEMGYTHVVDAGPDGPEVLVFEGSSR